jgi:hypothetical protein
MRCAVDGWSSVASANCFRLAASDVVASASSNDIMRSMTWMDPGALPGMRIK